MKKQKREYKLTIKRLVTQLHTWKRENREIYNQIMGIAEMLGLLTKRGNISIDKRKKEAHKQLIEKYKQDYGSYTSYMKRYSEKSQKIKRPKGMTVKQYVQKVVSAKEKINNFFEIVYKNDGREKAIEYYDIAMTLDINEMEQFIDDKLAEYRG